MRSKKYLRRSLKTLVCSSLLSSIAVAQVQNILTNGGFENGLMCYSTSIWNKANDPFPSDYLFVSSTDAHSGARSLEIRCVTANCVKAAIVSSKIPTPPSQAYKLSLYTKCPAGAEGYLYVPEVSGGSGYLLNRLACTGDWALNTANFATTATATDFSYAVYNFDTQSLRVDDVALTYADGTVPQRPILHAGNRNVSISGQRVNVDGSPYFAVGFTDVRYSDLGQAAAAGANTLMGFGFNGNGNCFNTAQESYLDLAYDYGLNFIPDSTTTARLAIPDAFPGVAAQYAHHLANIGWLLADEPDQVSVPAWTIAPSTLVSEYQAMAPAAALPILSDFQQASYSTPGATQPYIGATDIWMAEPFGSDFSSVTHAVGTFNSLATKPIWLSQDSVDASLIVPKAYWVAISGATGLLYFGWDDFKSQPDKLAAATQAFAELKQLTPAIFAANLAITAPTGVGAIGRTLNGSQYILAANPTSATVQGSFTVPALPANTPIQVMFENRTLTSNQGGFQDAFAGVSRHVYKIAPPRVSPQITWANPADITAGTPLSSIQLNATANVPGTFAYTPAAGTVLAAGNQQTIAVNFTPTDTTAYSGASASVVINIVAPKPAKLVLTRTITRDPATRELVISLNVFNSGGVAAQNVVITAASINTTSGTPLPQVLGTILPNATVRTTERFPASAGSTFTLAIVAVGGTFDGGPFALVGRALLP